MITAPFNFVPLSEKVFFPDWAEDVSHDLPFRDGVSGVVDITITVKSPIFIRDHDNPEQFCNYNGTEFIPGTSVKGMVRSVLEIMSFSKLNFFNNDRYAVRDMSNTKDYLSKMKPNNTYCGWLKKVGDDYLIEDCGIPGRIRLDKIGPKFSSRFNSNFTEKNDEDKSAKFKYELFSDLELPTHFMHKKSDNGREIYVPGEDKEGTIVFTGQPSKRVEGENPKGKIYEFIFFESDNELKVDEEVFKNFKFAYFDGRKTQPTESIDWGYWKEKLYNNEKIPVFFHKNQKNEVIHFGLSYLYKLPYNYDIEHAVGAVSEAHLSKDPDLAQTIFGFVDTSDGKALKGRVQFSHFKVDGKPERFKTVTTVLGKPRASYYPIYIKQAHQENGMVSGGDYMTLMKEKSQIAGRKRYPLHNGVPNPKKYAKDVQSATTFIPLGTFDENNKFKEFTFSGKMRYHNLKKVELGAILSALTFHGNSDFYHSLGMAKAYGFGKVAVEVSMKAEDQVSLLQEYERLMRKEVQDDWLESEQLTELFAMAYKDINIDRHLKYLELDPKNKRDEFREKKNAREYLPPVTTLYTSAGRKPHSFMDEIYVERFLETAKKKQEELKRKQEMLLEQNKLLEQTPPPMSPEYKDAIKEYVLKKIDLPYFDYAHLKLVFFEKEEEIVSDDIYNAYCDLIDMESYKEIEPLLRKRERGEATDIELAELYRLLKENVQ